MNKEKILCAERTHEAMQSLAIPLIRSRDSDKTVCCLTDYRYSVLYIGRTIRFDQIQGRRYPIFGGKKRIIKRALNDEGCIGLVPLTDEVYGDLTEKHGLNVVVRGHMVNHGTKVHVYNKSKPLKY